MQNAPIQLADFTPKDKERFWAKVNKDGPLPDQSNPHYAGLGPCWVWTAGKSTGKYGKFWVKDCTFYSHRVAWCLVAGEIPADLDVLHKCDNRICVNWDHLFLGTIRENNADRIMKGRSLNGEDVGTSKLTADQVSFIRERYQRGGITQESLGGRFGVGQDAVSLIIRRKNWKHLP